MSRTVPPASQQPRLDYVVCASPAGAHRMAYWEWGDPDNDRILLCVHGLTRSGRDFDPLAARLADHYRVVCPDVVGRGRSDWLIDPTHYQVPQYVSDMLTLVARLRPARLDWVGTSMGGLIGMGLAAALNLSPLLRPDRGAHGLAPEQTVALGKMVLNDIGPVIDADGLSRIAEYVGQLQAFSSFSQAVDYIREVAADFGAHDDAGWRALTEHVFVKDNDSWVKHYDLRIAQPMATEASGSVQASSDILWPAYESLNQPVLIVRGALSDLLTEETVEQMLQRNKQARLLTIPEVGHAPTLRSADQIEPIRDFLLQ